MSYLPINPCPKCGSRQRGMWLGGEGRPWRIVCEHCGLEQWFESGERACAEFIEHDERGMVHFGRGGLDIAFKLYELYEEVSE